MSSIKAISEAYKKQGYMHKKPVVCHSINVSSYKILCQEFFSTSLIKQKFIDMAEETNDVCNQAERDIILWLNGEWQW